MARPAHRIPRLALALLPLLLLPLLGRGAAQMSEPFPGSAAPPPPGGPVDIKVSALLERIVGIEQERSNYEAIWWVVLTWPDPTAAATVEAATGAALAPNGTCGLYCENQGSGSEGCCDGIWLPRLHVLNLIYLPQDQVPRYRILADPSSGTVMWSVRLVATWYSPFDFRAYPFEHQHLLLELGLADSQAAQAGLRWEHVAKLNNTPHTKGADLAGWRMKWGKGRLYDSRKCMAQYGVGAPSYAPPANGSPAGTPAVFTSVPVPQQYVAAALNASDVGVTYPDSCGTYTSVYDEGRALFPPLVLVADVMIKRVASYYVLTNLFPVLLITLVSFVTFFMPTDALGERMGVVLTMFLSLTAMQFVFAFPPANYINALQQVVLASYIVIAMACIESLIVNRLSTVSQFIHNKRGVVQKYGNLLSRAAFERYVSRELFPHGAKGSATSLPPGAGAAKACAHCGLRMGMGGMGAHGGMGGGMGGGAGGRGRVPRRSTATSTGSAPEARQGSANGGGAGGGAEVSEFVLPGAAGPPSPAPRTPARQRSRAYAARRRPAAIASTPPPSFPTSYPASTAPPAHLDDPDDAPAHAHAHVIDLHPTTSRVPFLSAAAAAAPSPFASARTQASFHSAAADGTPDGGAAAADAAPSICSDSAAAPPSSRRHSAAAAAAHWRRRVAALGLLGYLKVLCKAAGAWVVGVVTAPSSYYRQCKEDPEFATWLASRIDKWCCILGFVFYVVVVTVVLVLQVQLGDHKLMLGDRPGNM
ncbi:hypothetical protein HYH03_018342 [Edaphochlamys debaryana]|uniref:Neurotransmitter-gated ion-channel ligand-binding domain-containing protein n=1 Tax=Edaphochlamys debaryana TaxID=47281 RepID=A0A835XET7_9CHLO|nr:hypothetical protein HYH03_018342 [Edaphochlamys debaryana]|eukprot:KAG2482748.1 hypothetical protein HYH03_018342 [Edaphochlamys debaryana]